MDIDHHSREGLWSKKRASCRKMSVIPCSTLARDPGVVPSRGRPCLLTLAATASKGLLPLKHSTPPFHCVLPEGHFQGQASQLIPEISEVSGGVGLFFFLVTLFY